MNSSSRHSARSSARQRWKTAGALLVFGTVLAGCTPGLARPDVVIGTGSPGGTQYPLGGSICRLFNLETPHSGRRCVVVPSTGPVANVQTLRNGQIDIGVVESDVLADAVSGRGVFASSRRGPAPELRVLFTGHAEAFTIVARRELGVLDAAGLRGRRINMGSPGSGERVSMARVMTALGVKQSDFEDVRELSLADQHRALCAAELDAIVYSVGHPNGLIRDVTRMCDGVLVELSGPVIDDMLSRHPEYERAVIRGGLYRDNPVDVRTIGVRAVVVTTTRLSDALAYEITKGVFEHLEDFRRLHPSFAMLTVDHMIDAAGRAALHPGAARYYRARGWLR